MKIAVTYENGLIFQHFGHTEQFKDISLTSGSHGLPEVVAGVMVVVMQTWKRNAVLSILLGTVVYMFLIRIVI